MHSWVQSLVLKKRSGKQSKEKRRKEDRQEERERKKKERTQRYGGVAEKLWAVRCSSLKG